MELSKRLTAVAGFVEQGAVLADIGTDHGYVPIALVRRGVIPRAIAMDVNAGPLARAQAHIREYGLENRIETRLGDGLSQLRPGEADTLLIAGMGGPLICRILGEGMETARAARRLVLSPQSEMKEVRRFLCRHGFQIRDEAMVKEDGKYYVILLACPAAADTGIHTDEMMETAGPSPDAGVRETGQTEAGCSETDWTEADWAYGRKLLGRRDPVLREFLQKEREKYQSITGRLSDRETGSPAQMSRRKEVEEALAVIAQAERQWEIT